MIREMHDATKGRAAVDGSIDESKYLYDMRRKVEDALADYLSDGNHKPSARGITQELRINNDPIMLIARALWLYDSMGKAKSNVDTVINRVQSSAKAALDEVNATYRGKASSEALTAAMDIKAWDMNQEALRSVTGKTTQADVSIYTDNNGSGAVTVWRRRNLELQAIQYNGNWTGDGTNVLAFAGVSGNWDGINLEIKTKATASLYAVAGDWIVRKPCGQIAIIPDDVFREDYYQLGGDACGERQDAEQAHMDSLIAELDSLDRGIKTLADVVAKPDVGPYHRSVLEYQLDAMKAHRAALAMRIDEVSDHGEGGNHD